MHRAPILPSGPDSSSRDGLVKAILTFLSGQDLLTLDEIRVALEREIDDAGPQSLIDLKTRLVADAGWQYAPADPLARRIHLLLADRLMQSGSSLDGMEHIHAIGDRPVVIVANHLSYADANVIQMLLHRAGVRGLVERLTTLAGPKVFSDRQRRFSSLCFGTIKVPQSPDVASGEGVMNPREVARAAREAIAIARERLDAGDALLLFGEGTRSRTGTMQPMLPAVARYIEGLHVPVLPVGITGTEGLFPIDAETVHPVRVTARVGTPISASSLSGYAEGDRRGMMDGIGMAIARLLPASYRGSYSA